MRALRVLAVSLCLLITPAAITSAQVAPGPPQLVDMNILIGAVVRSPVDATDVGIVFPFDGLARVFLGGVLASGSVSGRTVLLGNPSLAGVTPDGQSFVSSIGLGIGLGIDIRVECRLRQDAQAEPGNFIADCTVAGHGTGDDSRGGLGGQGTGSLFVELFDGRPVEGGRISLTLNALVVCTKLCEAPRACRVDDECNRGEFCIHNVCTPVSRRP